MSKGSKRIWYAVQFLLLPACIVVFLVSYPAAKDMFHAFLQRTASTRVPAAAGESPLVYSFNVPGILEESGDLPESSSPYFWLNSGGRLIIENGIGKTLQGDDAAPLSRWRVAYAVSNPEDTDGGARAQNLFRLITRSEWKDVDEKVRFAVKKINLSKSQNRNESNGVLLFSRYEDSDNLYYAGLRVDGQAVIKKKIKGIYYTLKLAPWYASSTNMYNRDTAPNFIPVDERIGLRFNAKNNAEGGVDLKLFVAKGDSDEWMLAAEAVDDGKSFGGPAHTATAYAGIRTDFMDVEFDDYVLTEI